MALRPAPRRTIGFLAAAALTALAALAAPAAAYAESYQFSRPTAASYTDAVHPTRTLPGLPGPSWVGSWTDHAGYHTSRAYYTFDLSALHGATLISGSAVLAEASVNNCAAERKLEIWQTANPTGKITWDTAPAEVRKLASQAPSGLACPASYFSYDIGTAIQQALDGTGLLTLEIRLPDVAERQPRYGRSLASVGLQLVYNHPPAKPTNLGVRHDWYSQQRSCGTDPVWVDTTQPMLAANLTDVDGNQAPLTATFEIWPVGHADQKTQITTGFLGYGSVLAYATVPAGVLTDGGNYSWRVRGVDDQTGGAWSDPCLIGVDTTPPTGAVTASSTDYPLSPSMSLTQPATGGPGIPGTITFSAQGATDIVGFRYWVGGELGREVVADAPGGKATVTYAPNMAGFLQLTVTGIDRAGNPGPFAEYYFRVKDTRPTVTDLDPDAGFGKPHRLRFTPGMDGVTSYEYAVNDGPKQTVAAAADGTAQVSVVFDQSFNTVRVASLTATGLRTDDTYFSKYVNTSPTVSSPEYPDGDTHGGIGVPGTFTVTATIPNVVAFNWSLDYGEVSTITPDASGVAHFTWTPTESGGHTLVVTQVTADGFESEPNYYSVRVASNQPTVSSDVYQPYTASGGPGVTGHFVLTAHQPGAVAFRYTLGSAAEVSLPVGADGTATIDFTPVTGGTVELHVHTVDAAGTASDAAYTQADVDPKYPVIDQSDNGSGEYTFVFTATLAGSTEFVYSLDGADPATLAVGADGTARIVWTPTPGTVHTLAVYSKAGGLTSSTWTQYFYVG